MLPGPSAWNRGLAPIPKTLQVLSRAEHFDAKRARELAETGAKAMAGMALERARMQNQVFTLLTPEQRTRMLAMDAAFTGRCNRSGRPD